MSHGHQSGSRFNTLFPNSFTRVASAHSGKCESLTRDGLVWFVVFVSSDQASCTAMKCSFNQQSCFLARCSLSREKNQRCGCPCRSTPSSTLFASGIGDLLLCHHLARDIPSGMFVSLVQIDHFKKEKPFKFPLSLNRNARNKILQCKGWRLAELMSNTRTPSIHRI